MPYPGTVAWMESLLRERLGADAELGAVTFTGRMLHLDGARLPLGRGAELHMAHAVVELGAGPLLGELPLSARLVALACEIRALGRTLTVAFTARDDDDASFAYGTLRVGDVEATLRILPAGWSVSAERLSAHGQLSPLGFAGLTATQLPLALGLGLPADLTLTGTLERRPDRGLVADLALGTARSRLALTGAASSTLDDVRLTGRLSLADVMGLLPGGSGPTPEATFDLDVVAEGSLADPTLRGRVFADEVRLARAGVAPLRIAAVSLTVDADRRHLRVSNLLARARDARVGGWAHVSFGAPAGDAVPLLALQVDRVDAPLLVEIAAVAAGIRLPLARPGVPGIPPDLVLGGEVMVTAERGAAGSFSLETPRSALTFHLALAPDRALLGSTLRGRFAAADAVHVGLAGGPVRPRPADVLTLDARLSGTLGRPGIAGRLSAVRLSLQAGREGDSRIPPIEVEEASVLLDVGPMGLTWNQLTGRLYGGSLTSSGRLGRDTGALDATVVWSGIRIECLPFRVPGDRPLAETLRGACSGELRVERESFVAHALVAAGRVTVAEPVYPFVRSVASALSRYGLPPLAARGEGPLTATLRFEHGELVVSPASASLDGIDVDGTLRAGVDGSLLGRLRVHLLEDYLARSPLLAIPAAFSGTVVIPVYVRGTPGALQVETDAIEILDGLLTGSRVGDAMKTVLDSLWSAARPSRKRR